MSPAHKKLFVVVSMQFVRGLCGRFGAKNKEDNNSAVEAYFQCGLDEVRLRAQLDLLEQMASEPCFNTLRTQEQLGYSVSCGVRLTHNVLGFAFVILSGQQQFVLLPMVGFIDTLPADNVQLCLLVVTYGLVLNCHLGKKGQCSRRL